MAVIVKSQDHQNVLELEAKKTISKEANQRKSVIYVQYASWGPEIHTNRKLMPVVLVISASFARLISGTRPKLPVPGTFHATNGGEWYPGFQVWREKETNLSQMSFSSYLVVAHCQSVR